MSCKSLLAAAILLLHAPAVPAQNDTIRSKELDEVTVEASRYRLGAEKSSFTPTKDQKKSAMSGPDLVRRLAIPRLKPSGMDGVTTLNGKEVKYFIDFMPATKPDLDGMRTTDVKRVEYYEFPTDPRFQGAQYAVNFVMAKLQYGGYVRAGGQANILANSGQADTYGKMQYKAMSFDFFGGLWGRNSKHIGQTRTEIFRLPQPDGLIKEFERLSITDRAKEKRDTYWLGGRISWLSKGITLRNYVGAEWNRTPVNRNHGSVTYTPADFPASDYTSGSNSRDVVVSYSGNLFVQLPKGNSINFIPEYAHSHTRTNSEYAESSTAPIINGANDNSDRVGGQLRFNHSFGKAGTLMTMASATYQNHKTRYSGTSDIFDEAENAAVQASIRYSATINKIYIYASGAFEWYKNKLGSTKETGVHPYAGISLQWSPDSRQAASLSLSYSSDFPSDNYKSSAIVKISPLMSITGNPALRPVGAYGINASYSYMVRPNLSVSAYGSANLYHNRYVTAYTASAEGILRTYMQPAGAFRQLSYGISSSLSLLNNALNLNADISHSHTHNGNPYNWSKNSVNFSAGVFFYKGNFNFGGYYIAPVHTSGVYDGIRTINRSIYYLQAGWSNGALKARVLIRDFARWHYNGIRQSMQSKDYSYSTLSFSDSNHAFVKLELYYTLSFGKKVTDRNEASRSGNAGSGILK